MNETNAGRRARLWLAAIVMLLVRARTHARTLSAARRRATIPPCK